MKHALTYVILQMVSLLSISLFVSSRSVAEHEIISFFSREHGTGFIHFINTQGELLQGLPLPDLKPQADSLTWSPDGGSFACQVLQNRNLDIYVMDVNKKTHRRLTVNVSRDRWPAWSPNGKWIAFVSDRAGGRDIYRLDVNGKNLKQLTKRGGCHKPAWSPDSQWIAFTSVSEGRKYFIFLMNANGGELRKLTQDVRVSLPGCTWSPDGEQIAFISNGAEGGVDIFSIDIDGENLRQLTWADQDVFIASPVWSPSGKWITYTLAKVLGPLKPVLLVQDFDNPVICVVNTAGGGAGKPLEMTRGLTSNDGLDWVPGFLPVSPSAEKQTTRWGKLKQMEDAAK